jgi:uncharacterized protein YecE (DUF72 family)
MSGILYGTSSWSTAGWVGPFYPSGTRPADFLAAYAGQFGTVEADVTYYRVPSESMVAGWARNTPDGFVIAAKFPRSVVHCGDGPRPDGSRLLVPSEVGQDALQFCETMALLGDKCGPLVLQFPYFNKSVFPSQEPFLERLDEFLDGLPKELRYAVEVRNKGWLGRPLTELLRRHAVGLVLVDMNYMPHPADVARGLDVVTTDFLYGRLIGDRKAVEERTKRFDEIVVDRQDRLLRWADLLGALTERVSRTYIYANNHYAGHGPETIRQLQQLMERPG